jgi:hypothetical protein
MRDFGAGYDAVRLQIDSYGSWNLFRMLLVGRPVGRSNGPSGRGSFRLPGDPEDRGAQLLLGTSGDDKLPAVSFDISFGPYVDPAIAKGLSDTERRQLAHKLWQPHPDFDAKVDRITVQSARGSPLELHIGNMAAPLAAMRACVDDLYRSWGLDAAAQKSLSREARPKPLTIKHVQQDYPGGDLLTGTSAYVPVRLMIDANGKSTSCVVQSAAADDAFKAAVCQNLQGQFDPALDANGIAVPSMFHTFVIYLIAE